MSPQIVLILVSTLSGSNEVAHKRAKLGIGLIAGTTVMLLTLIWGTIVSLGSYNVAFINIDPGSFNLNSFIDLGIVTDVETANTASKMQGSMLPLFLLLLAIFFGSSGSRVIMLIALIITALVVFHYILNQIIPQQEIQSRRFEYLMNKYPKDNLFRIFSGNGQPDTTKIDDVFKKLDKDNSASISAAELRVLLLGVNMDENDLSNNKDVESILASFNTNEDGRINQEEFTRGMTELVDGLDKSSSHQQRATNSWLNYSKAAFFVTIGLVMLCVFAEPLIRSVLAFSEATNLPSFCVSYLAIPFAINYGVAVQLISSARQQTKKSISLTLSVLYEGVHLNNIIGLFMYLSTVYARHLKSKVAKEVIVVIVICTLMTGITRSWITFSRWVGYVAVILYPISLGIVFLLIS